MQYTILKILNLMVKNMKIIISSNIKKIKRYLKNSSEKYYYINFGEKKEVINELLNKNILLEEITLNKYNQKFKDKFIQLYIDLIGKLGSKYNSIYWWVTQTSSKNQFGSKFFENLFYFYIIINEIKLLQKKQKINMLIINSSKTIYQSLNKYCNENNIKITIHDIHIYNISKNLFKKYKNILYFLYRKWKKIYLSHKYLKKIFNKNFQSNKKYYILKTWLYSRTINENNKYHDSFFGVLPEYLIKKCKEIMIITDIIEDYHSNIKKIANNNDFFLITPEFFDKYSDPIRCIINIYSNKIKINEKIDFEGFDISDILRAELNEEYTKNQILNDYMYKFYIEGMLNIVDIDTFTTTYENYPWEKMCFLTLKKRSPQTHIIGYQHAAICKASIMMNLSNYEKNIIPIPDKINTMGKISKDYLKKYGNYNGKNIKESCALRFEMPPPLKEIKKNKTYKILIALRGIPKVTIGLVNFIYDSLKDNKQYSIIMRTHPTLHINQFKDNLNFDIKSWKNLLMSTNKSVKKDIQESDIIIYEGSMLSIESLMMGKPVIHVELNDLLNSDPLFQCTSFKYTVDKKEDLIKKIRNIYQFSDDEYYKKQISARKYIDNYVYNITDERLNDFII